MQRKYVFNIKIDFEKSHGSFILDKYTNIEFLDFFSMFSSLPLGYNHNIFDDTFDRKVTAVARCRMANNLFESDELIDFLNQFRKYVFSDHIHLTCTGALAVEAAIKCAMEYKKVKSPMVLAVKRAFHGINSWGFITDRCLNTTERVKNFPQNSWQNLELAEIINYLETKDCSNLVSVVVEPIQCTSGDVYLDPQLLMTLQALCREKDVCFIMDEIQTGFGVTGKMWYYEHLGLQPDVLVFGKKSQICGIVASEKYSECMKSPYRKLEVTFDGELIDAIRASYILRAYERDDLISKVNHSGERFSEILRKKVLNYRSKGHLIAFDFDSKDNRNAFVKECYKHHLLCNPTGDCSVRIRPSLATTSREIDYFEEIVSSIL